MGIMLLFDFLFRVFLLPFPSKQNIFVYLFSLGVLVESFSIPSVILSGTGVLPFINLNYLRVIPLYRSVLSLYYRDGDELESDLRDSRDLKGYIGSWAAYLLALFYTLAATVYVFETLPSSGRWASDEWTPLNSMYFMVVTMTTVGYGDFSPSSYPGVIFMMFAMVLVLFYIASKVSVVLDVYSMTKAGKGSYVRRRHIPFVSVVGKMDFSDFVVFLASFYSIPSLSNTQVVVLSKTLEWSKDDHDKLERHSRYGQQVKILAGTPLNPADRKRAAIEHAEAIFAFSPGCADDAPSQDSRNILRVVALRDRYPKIPIYASHILPSSFVHLDRTIRRATKKGLPGSAICQKEYWASLAALNLRCPGSSTLLINLFHTWDTALHETDLPWLREYKLGASNSLSALIVDRTESELTLADFCIELYLDRGVLLLAIVDGPSNQMLFPNLHSDALVLEGSVAFLIGNETKIRVMKNSDWFLPVDLVANRRQQNALSVLHKLASASLPENESVTQEDAAPLPKPQKLAPTTPDSALRKHLIISGYTAHSLADAELLVESLGQQFYDARNSNQYDEIVVLLPNLSNAAILSFKQKCPHVRVRTGSAIVLEDLIGAGLLNAHALVVLLEPIRDNDGSSIDVDSKAVFTMLLVDQVSEECRDELQVISFIRDTDVVGLLRVPQPRQRQTRFGVPQSRLAVEISVDGVSKPDQNSLSAKPYASETDPRKLLSEEFFVRPRYAAGEIILTPLTSTLLARDYQTPGALRLLKFLTDIRSDVPTCKLHLLGVPAFWAGWSYWQIFRALMDRHALPIGLLRSGRGPMWMPPVVSAEKGSLWSRKRPEGLQRTASTESLGALERTAAPGGSQKVSGGSNALPWVYSNPESHTIVLSTDAIYVLATVEVYQELVDLHAGFEREAGNNGEDTDATSDAFYTAPPSF